MSLLSGANNYAGFFIVPLGVSLPVEGGTIFLTVLLSGGRYFCWMYILFGDTFLTSLLSGTGLPVGFVIYREILFLMSLLSGAGLPVRFLIYRFKC